MYYSFFYRITRKTFLYFGGILLLLLSFVQGFSQTEKDSALRGSIADSNRLLISKAKIKIISEFGNVTDCLTDNQGGFSCNINFDGKFTLEIQAEGFSILRQSFTKLQDFPQDSIFTLMPLALREEIIVTATRTETRLGETPASIVTLSKAEINTTAAPTIDDALRQVAGFSLFRRSGSRNTNPTAQGVSLRGVGASGASRSLVLLDRVALNDSFGGWIIWSRVPPIAVERIEVLRGGAASLYGSDSLSGTINIIPRKVREKYAFSAEVFGGTQNTFSASTFSGFKIKDWSADFVASNFQTKGYILIDKNVRGAVDSFAGSRNSNFSARIEKTFGENLNLFFKPSYFGEARTNGTPLQINRTHLREFVFGGELNSSNPKSKIQNPKLTWLFYGGTQVFDQTFSSISADRNSESLIRRQRVPTQNFGFSSQFSGVVGKNQTLVTGFEAREVRGASDEVGFLNNRATFVSSSGGRERTFSAFLQDFARIGSRLILAGSARFDAWQNIRASSSTRTLSNNQTTTVIFPSRRESAFSPQISALFQATKDLSFYALASKSFRAPTLNELYRGFRVGNVVTNANENLRAEKAANFETGANFSLAKIYLRGNLFRTNISQPIANVTLSSAPNLITRQRQNVGKTRTQGLEIEAETRFRNFNFSVGYLLTDSRVLDFPANRSLEGLFIPQVALHQFTFQTNYSKKAWTLSFQGRASSKQFDDDLNLFRLEPYFQLDAFAAKKFKEKAQIFAAIENIFSSLYSIGKTPVRTVSSPINLRVGIRFK